VVNRKLEYLIALSKIGHFARAAAACKVSQPALSAGIQQLEHELGVQIVKRGQRYQGLTEQGEIVLAWARRIQSESKTLQAQLRASDQCLHTLRIGALNTTGPFTSLFTIPFERRFPEVSIRLMHGRPFEIQQGIEDLSYDVIVGSLDLQREHYLRWFELYEQEYYVFTSKEGLLSGRAAVSWEDLREVPVCLFPPETHVFDEDIYQSLGPPAPGVPRLETNNMFVLLDHVRTGCWVSVLPKPVLFMVAKSEGFDAIPLPRRANPGVVGIAIPYRAPLNHLAETFFECATSPEVLDQFREVFQSLPNTSVAGPVAHPQVLTEQAQS
jgi:DNA-binding transcriptional LysR family regulator